MNLDDNEQVKLVLENLVAIESLNGQGIIHSIYIYIYIYIVVTKDDVEDLEEDEEDEAIIIPNPEPEEHWEREETGPEEKAEEAPPEAEYQEPEYPEPEGVQELEMKQEDLEEVAMLYDSIRALRRKTKPEMDKVLAADFDKSIKTMMNQYKSNTNTKDPIQIKNTYILKAKYGLFGICFEKIIEHVKTVDPHIGEILEGLQAGHTSIIGELVELILRLTPQMERDLQYMQEEVKKAQTETSEVLAAAENLESQMKDTEGEKGLLKRQHDGEKRELERQIESLEAENKKYFETIIKHSKGHPTPVVEVPGVGGGGGGGGGGRSKEVVGGGELGGQRTPPKRVYIYIYI